MGYPHTGGNANPCLCTSPANIQHSFLFPFRRGLTVLLWAHLGWLLVIHRSCSTTIFTTAVGEGIQWSNIFLGQGCRRFACAASTPCICGDFFPKYSMFLHRRLNCNPKVIQERKGQEKSMNTARKNSYGSRE